MQEQFLAVQRNSLTLIISSGTFVEKQGIKQNIICFASRYTKAISPEQRCVMSLYQHGCGQIIVLKEHTIS